MDNSNISEFIWDFMCCRMTFELFLYVIHASTNQPRAPVVIQIIWLTPKIYTKLFLLINYVIMSDVWNLLRFQNWTEIVWITNNQILPVYVIYIFVNDLSDIWYMYKIEKKSQNEIVAFVKIIIIF